LFFAPLCSLPLNQKTTDHADHRQQQKRPAGTPRRAKPVFCFRGLGERQEYSSLAAPPKSEELTTEAQRHRKENTEKRTEPIEKGRERADP
jgi:hypothetical protein